MFQNLKTIFETGGSYWKAGQEIDDDISVTWSLLVSVLCNGKGEQLKEGESGIAQKLKSQPVVSRFEFFWDSFACLV